MEFLNPIKNRSESAGEFLWSDSRQPVKKMIRPTPPFFLSMLLIVMLGYSGSTLFAQGITGSIYLDAELGVVDAQKELGDKYYFGLEVEQDLTIALRWYRMAAEGGDRQAQYSTGRMYYLGEGVSQNYEEAARWYRMAAEQEHAQAQYSIGRMHKFGEGVEQDSREALRWFRLAADQGNANAQYSIGEMHYLGEVIKHDLSEAYRWFQMAADQGDAQAQFSIGRMYYLGEKVKLGTPAEPDLSKYPAWMLFAMEQDSEGKLVIEPTQDALSMPTMEYGEAMRWLRMAADQGHAQAQYYIGLMYEHGYGVVIDNRLSHMWWNIAHANGFKDAWDSIIDVEQEMSQSEILEATEMANKCMESDYQECEEGRWQGYVN